MRPALPWLSQGDIFIDVPIVITEAGTTPGGVNASIESGPAVLVSHDCVLDKTNRRFGVRIHRMFFLPLLSISVAGDSATTIRRDRHEPVEYLYVPDAGRFGECFCLLSEAYYLPATIFRPRLAEFEHAHAEPGRRHLEATARAGRVGRLDAERLELLRDKWTGFWTRRVADGVVLPEDEGVRDAVVGLGRASQRVVTSLARSVRHRLSRE